MDPTDHSQCIQGDYRVYDLLTPHCERAVEYRAIGMVKRVKGQPRKVTRERRHRCSHRE